jgi:hypothetical protein
MQLIVCFVLSWIVPPPGTVTAPMDSPPTREAGRRYQAALHAEEMAELQIRWDLERWPPYRNAQLALLQSEVGICLYRGLNSKAHMLALTQNRARSRQFLAERHGWALTGLLTARDLPPAVVDDEARVVWLRGQVISRSRRLFELMNADDQRIFNQPPHQPFLDLGNDLQKPAEPPTTKESSQTR